MILSMSASHLPSARPSARRRTNSTLTTPGEGKPAVCFPFPCLMQRSCRRRRPQAVPAPSGGRRPPAAAVQAAATRMSLKNRIVFKKTGSGFFKDNSGFF